MAQPKILPAEEFPQLREEDSVKEQIKALYDYVFKLREQLQYTLSNLTAENWNAAALDGLLQRLVALAGEEESG